MTEQPVQFSGSQAGGEPVTTPTAGEPKYLTESAIEPMLDRLVEKLNRQQQGLAKKREDRILAEVNKRLEAVRLSGVQMSPEQQQTFQQATANQVLNDFTNQVEPPPAPTTPAQVAQTGQQPQKSDVQAAIEELWSEHGEKLYPNDPEASKLDNTSPLKFLKSYEAALLAKKVRTSQPASARIPAGGGGTGASLMDEYQAKAKGLRGTQLVVLRAEYRKKGLLI